MERSLRPAALILTLTIVAFLIVAATLGIANSQTANGAYDADNDGLIEVSNLEQLNAIRYDLDGDGRPTGAPGIEEYADAFPTASKNRSVTATAWTMNWPDRWTSQKLTATPPVQSTPSGRPAVGGCL